MYLCLYVLLLIPDINIFLQAYHFSLPNISRVHDPTEPTRLHEKTATERTQGPSHPTQITARPAHQHVSPSSTLHPRSPCLPTERAALHRDCLSSVKVFCETMRLFFKTTERYPHWHLSFRAALSLETSSQTLAQVYSQSQPQSHILFVDCLSKPFGRRVLAANSIVSSGRGICITS